MSFVGFLSSINSSYHIFGDFNIHVDVPGGYGYKLIRLFILQIRFNIEGTTISTRPISALSLKILPLSNLLLILL